MSSLKSDNEILSGILADKEIYVDNLISRIGELERLVVDQHEISKLADTQILTLQQDNLELNQAFEGQSKVVSELTQAIELADAQISTLEQDNLELNQSTKAQSKMVSELTQAIELADAQISTLEQDKLELNQSTKEQSKVISELTQTIEILGAQISTLEQGKLELNQASKNQSKVISELTQTIESKKNIIQNLIMLVDNLDRRCQEIFESRTWKIGFKLAHIKRVISHKDVDESSKTFITYNHINKIIKNNSAYSHATSINNTP